MKIYISNKYRNLGVAFFGALVYTLIAMTVFNLTGGSSGSGILNRLSILLGGNFLDGGYIQSITVLAFMYGLIEILLNLKAIEREQKAFVLQILPVDEKHVLMANDIIAIKDKIKKYEKKKFMLIELIRKACTKFRATRSVSELLEIITIQADINYEKSESQQSTIRYLNWTIPSLGFIGTVLGISQALVVANSGDIAHVTATLGVAFDTTLVSLILSLILMGFFHKLQERNDNLHANIKEYVVENLVNRIEV